MRLLALLALALVFATNVTASTPAPDVPTAITALTVSLNSYYHGSKKTGGLGYSVARTQETNVYKALVALGGTWPAVTPTPAPAAAALTVSPTGDDATCSSGGTPCGSFSRAYELAPPGTTIDVSAGSYPSQVIPYLDSKPAGSICRAAETFRDGTATPLNLSGCVTFQAEGAVTVSGKLLVAVPYVRLVGITAGSLNIGWDGSLGGPCSAYDVHDVIAEGIVASSLQVGGATYTYIEGGSFGGTDPGVSSAIAGCYPGNGQPSTQSDHLVIDGATFHDVIQTAQGQHLECVHWFDGSESVIRDTIFVNCAQFDLSIQPDGTTPGADASGMLIAGDTFDVPCSAQTLNTAGGQCGANEALTTQCFAGQPVPTDVTIESSVFVGGNAPQFISNTGGACFSPTLVTGNTLGGYTAYECQVYEAQGVTFAGNTFSDGSECP